MVYIERFKGSPLAIEVSIFKRTRTAEQEEEAKDQSSGMLDLLGNLGMRFTNISGAPL